MNSFFRNNAIVLLTQILFLATQPEEKTKDEDREMRDHLAANFNLFMPTDLFGVTYKEAIDRGYLAVSEEKEGAQEIKVSPKGARQAMRSLNASLADNAGVNFANLARGSEKKPTTLAYRVSMACHALEAAAEVAESQTIPAGLIERYEAALEQLKLKATPVKEQAVEA